MVTKLEEVEERGGKVLSAMMSNLPLVVRGAARFRPGHADRASTSTRSRSPTGPTGPCSG